MRRTLRGSPLLTAGRIPRSQWRFFPCADAVQGGPRRATGPDPVDRGLNLARRLGHLGAEASSLASEADWHIRQGGR